MADTTGDVRREMAGTRERMSETVTELEQRLERGIQNVRERVDLREVVREHPWSALGVAVLAGVLLARGADRRAIAGAAGAARRVPDAARGLAQRVRAPRGSDAAADAEALAAADARGEPEREGVLLYLLRGQVTQLGDELRIAAEEFGNGSRASR